MSELTVAYRPVWYVEPNGKRHGPFVEQADVQPLLDRLAAAEAKVARVEALAEGWEARLVEYVCEGCASPNGVSTSPFADDLRVALTEEA